MDSLREQWALERRRGEEDNSKGRGEEGAREKSGDGKRRVGLYRWWRGGGGEKMREEERRRGEGIHVEHGLMDRRRKHRSWRGI